MNISPPLIVPVKYAVIMKKSLSDDFTAKEKFKKTGTQRL